MPNCCSTIRHLAKGATLMFHLQSMPSARACVTAPQSLALPEPCSTAILPIIADQVLYSSHRFLGRRRPRCHAGQARCDPRLGAQARQQHLALYYLRLESVMAHGMRHGRGGNPRRHPMRLLESLRPSLHPSLNLPSNQQSPRPPPRSNPPASTSLQRLRLRLRVEEIAQSKTCF